MNTLKNQCSIFHNIYWPYNCFSASPWSTGWPVGSTPNQQGQVQPGNIAPPQQPGTIQPGSNGIPQQGMPGYPQPSPPVQPGANGMTGNSGSQGSSAPPSQNPEPGNGGVSNYSKRSISPVQMG